MKDRHGIKKLYRGGKRVWGGGRICLPRLIKVDLAQRPTKKMTIWLDSYLKQVIIFKFDLTLG